GRKSLRRASSAIDFLLDIHPGNGGRVWSGRGAADDAGSPGNRLRPKASSRRLCSVPPSAVDPWGGQMRFLFADCVLDLERRELTRDAGAIAAGPQVFDLLIFLVQNRERVVSKDDLL